MSGIVGSGNGIRCAIRKRSTRCVFVPMVDWWVGSVFRRAIGKRWDLTNNEIGETHKNGGREMIGLIDHEGLCVRIGIRGLT